MSGKLCPTCFRAMHYDREMSVKLGSRMVEGRLVPYHNYYVCPVHGCPEMKEPRHGDGGDGRSQGVEAEGEAADGGEAELCLSRRG